MKHVKIYELFDSEELKDYLGWKHIDRFDNPSAKKVDHKKRLDTVRQGISGSTLHNDTYQAFTNWLTFEFPFMSKASVMDQKETQIFMFKNKKAFISLAFDVNSKKNIDLSIVNREFDGDLNTFSEENFTSLKDLSNYIRA